jgi:hypothetical protein
MNQLIRKITIILGLSLMMAPSASAISNYDLTAIIRYTPFYDKKASEAACATDTGGVTADVTGDNIKDAYNYFIKVGFKDYQAAGIIGNLMQESGVDPKAQQDGSNDPNPKNGVGFGIVQWTYSDRQGPLVALAKKRNKPPTDLGVQLEYVMQELNGGFKDALTAIKASTDVRSAAVAWATKYEICKLCSGIGDPGNRENIRLTNAQKVLDQAKKEGWGGATPGGSTGGTGGTTTGSDGCTSAAGDVSGSKIVQIALAEKGTNEGGTNNAGGACKYEGSACPPGQEWCADFVSWVYKQAGAPFTGGEDGGWRIAGSGAVAEWFKANATWIPNPGKPVPVGDPRAPQPGDVVFYGPGPHVDGSGHVNIVVSYDGHTVTTIGGNQSNQVEVGTYYDVFAEAEGWGRLNGTNL